MIGDAPRAALISNLCPHYRRALYEVLAERLHLECYFFAEQAPYWNASLPAVEKGQFTQVQLRRVNILGEPLLPGLARSLTRGRYDVVVVGLVGRLMVPFVYAIARARGIPFVLWTGVWDHPQTFFHRLTEPITRFLYRRADAIVVYGDHVRAALNAVRGVDDAKIFTAAQAVDGRRFTVPSDPAASREIVYVGRFVEEKGLRCLVAAFALVDSATLRLTLIGDGSLEPELRARVAEDERIELVGTLPQSALAARLASARCLVLPSETTARFKESWGLVVNEAMHAGLPVIATDAVGAVAAGLVIDGVTGIVVREQDPIELADALRVVGADDSLVERMGRRGRERVAAYTFDAMADAFEAAIRFARKEHGDAGAQ